MKFIIRNEDEIHDALIAIIEFYQTHSKSPALLHVLADVLYFMYGGEKCVEALKVVDKALSEWKGK